MYKYVFILIVSLLFSQKSDAQVMVPPSPVKWYSFAEAIELNKKAPKPFFVDFYTDWCGWCKKMMATTFANNEVAAYLNNNFYPVRFDAEGQDTIVFKDSTYVNRMLRPSKSTHDLAVQLLRGQLTYPTVMFLDKDLNALTTIPGYREARELLPILIFFKEEMHTAGIDYQDYLDNFNLTYPEQGKPQRDTSQYTLKWYSIEEALELNQKEPKKILIDIYVNWQIGCNIMYHTTYNNPEVSTYINENFYPVRINAITRDTLVFGESYVNPGKAPSFHQLPYAMLQGKMKFPAVLFLDENNKLVNKIQFYSSPKSFEPILKYFGENAYKEKSWEDYRKEFKTEFFAKSKETESKRNKP